MGNKLKTFPVEVFGGLFGRAKKALKGRKNAIDKAMKGKKKKK